MLETQQGFAVLCVDEKEMTPALDVAIRELLCECFPSDDSTFRRTRAWHGSGPEFTMVYCEGARALGHVGVVVREVLCDGRLVEIAGIQNVAVHPDKRRTGLSRQVMQEAMEEAARRGISYGLLFCVPGLERFYSFLGWERIEPTVTMTDEQGALVTIDDKNVCMIKDLTGAPLYPRSVDLQGADW